MTMIRINLIAEKKTGAPKAAKKPTRQQSEIQENLIIIVMILIALAVCFFLFRNVQNQLDMERSENSRLTKEYKELEVWNKRKEDLDIQKILLNEKIQKIRNLKDNREGPVKVMEDVFNALPESVWFQSITQGFDKNLVQASGSNRTAFQPGSRNLGEPALVKVTGFAKTTESITSFADRLLELDTRYKETELNNIEQIDTDDGKVYAFEIFFRVLPGSGAPDQSPPEDGG